MSYFEPQNWRLFTRKELSDYLNELQGREKNEGANEKLDKGTLIVRELISPLDLYTYLKARFGNPNGIQTILKADDSDNLFHWDYYIMAGDRRLYFVGTTQDIHVRAQDDLTDQEWLDLFAFLKGDFSRIGKEKSAVFATLEKWSIFPNKFLSMANKCSDAYSKLQSALSILKKIPYQGLVGNLDQEQFSKIAKKRSKALHLAISSSLELNILPPVLFESFIGLLIGCFIKKDVKNNERVYQSFIRSQLDIKLFDLHIRCNGFERNLEPENKYMKRYWDVVNRRNNLFHGNIDPEKDALETVYFDKKIPLYKFGADGIESFQTGLLKQTDPERVIADYIAAHEFIYEIIDHMEEAYKLAFI